MSPEPGLGERPFDFQRPIWERVGRWIRSYALGEDPGLGTALAPMCLLSALLYTRNPIHTNFIFDEQEALLANPYVRSISDPTSKLRWLDAFYTDFWGLSPDRTIGSYRPIPNLIWRLLWGMGARDTPFLHHWINVLLHGLNAALITAIAMRITRERLTAWLAGLVFVTSAVLTEAVSGVVGIADVLGGLGAILALMSLALPMAFMPLGVFAATLFGLYSKESALACVPLVPLAALFTAHLVHEDKPQRVLRAALALVATTAAFVLYVEARRRMFPATLPRELSVEANLYKPPLGRAFAAIMRWYAQPNLPRDPLNNPLVLATTDLRIAGAWRVFTRGLGQVLFPWTLSGDYSAPQEPIPSRVWFVESILGALAMVVPLVVAPVALWKSFQQNEAFSRPAPRHTDGPALLARCRDAQAVVALCLLWIVISYFPVSNIPVVLPTVRAERFWYFPVLGSSIVLAMGMMRMLAWSRARHRGFAAPIPLVCLVAVVLFFGNQAWAARRHASHYENDLVFWDATRRAVPQSAKAHLNYSVMQGARGHLDIRLESNAVALVLAPQWPMANVYYGDTLCRLHRAEQSWPHLERGFSLAPNDRNLIALGLQCLWEEKRLTDGSPLRTDLDRLSAQHPGTWLEYLARDILTSGEEHNGVDPKYRPRGYDQGPKKEE